MTIKEYIENFFKIKTKDGRLVEFKFNAAQNKFYEMFKKDYGKKPARYIVLKARQLGMSTLIEALITCMTITQYYRNALITAHQADATQSIYDMTKRYVDNLPEPLKPSQKYSNQKRLVFDRDDGQGLDSSIRVMTVGDGARSSTFTYAHLSEFAFWDNAKEAMAAIMQTVPNTNDSVVVIESTANGFNHFYDEWQRAVEGKSDFTPVFFPWYIDPSYAMPYNGFELTDYEKNIKEKYELSLEQLSWRRWCINNNCNGDESIFRQEYPISPEEAFVASGDCVFNTETVLARINSLPKYLRRGRFKYSYDGLHITDIRFVDDPKGEIKIYKAPDGNFTVLGGDTAGEGEDYFTGHVLSKEGVQLAVYHGQEDEDLYTRQMYCLGTMYRSLIAIETNFSTYSNMELQRLGYPYLYIREVFDTALKKLRKSFGFQTNSVTRPVIISNLVEIFRENIQLINDEETLKEALSFVRIKGKPQAAEGAHDDLIMGLAIAYHAIEQIPSEKKKKVENNSYQSFIDYGG